MKKKLLLIGAVAIGSFAMSGCKKSDGDGGTPGTPGTPDQKTYKFTVKVTGASAGEYVSVVFSGGDFANTKTIWKVNGVERSNEKVFGFDQDDFLKGETYVVESTVPLLAVSAGLSAVNNDATPITLSFQPVVAGKAEAAINEVVSKDFNKSLNY